MPKKILALVAVAAGGLVFTRRAAARRAEQDLWTEATDPIDLR